MAPWRRRGPAPRLRAANAFFLLWVGGQTVVPLWLLTQPRPARFGWQMYSATAATLEVEAVDARGAARSIQPAAYVLRLRRDLPLAELLPPHLCRVLPAAAAIRVREGPAAPEQRWACR